MPQRSQVVSGMNCPPGCRTALAGLFVRKEAWRLSWRGKLLALALALGLLLGLQRGIYGFLAVNDRRGGDCLVVEGWISASELREAWSLFQKGSYQKIIVSGGPVKDQWDTDLKVTFADWGVSKLIRLGVPTNLIQRVPSWVEQKDRTYYSAVAVRDWFSANHIPIKRMDVFTEGAHARRTRLLYEKAFGDEVQIGIIAAVDPEFDPSHWWQSSEGVREVIGEGIAYLYARILFHPSRVDNEAANKPLNGGGLPAMADKP
jgi:hypothetical protein